MTLRKYENKKETQKERGQQIGDETGICKPQQKKKCLFIFAHLTGWVIWADWAAHADDDMYSPA